MPKLVRHMQCWRRWRGRRNHDSRPEYSSAYHDSRLDSSSAYHDSRPDSSSSYHDSGTYTFALAWFWRMHRPEISLVVRGLRQLLHIFLRKNWMCTNLQRL